MEMGNQGPDPSFMLYGNHGLSCFQGEDRYQLEHKVLLQWPITCLIPQLEQIRDLWAKTGNKEKSHCCDYVPSDRSWTAPRGGNWGNALGFLVCTCNPCVCTQRQSVSRRVSSFVSYSKGFSVSKERFIINPENTEAWRKIVRTLEVLTLSVPYVIKSSIYIDSLCHGNQRIPTNNPYLYRSNGEIESQDGS